MSNPKLPGLGPLVSVGAGWHIQSVRMIQRPANYVKIYNPAGEVVDRALTLSSARRMAKRLKAKELMELLT